MKFTPSPSIKYTAFGKAQTINAPNLPIESIKKKEKKKKKKTSEKLLIC